mgnify:CR=1 FL=1
MSFEKKLKQAIRKNDLLEIEKVFEKIYYKYGKLIGFVISKYVSNSSDVEELVKREENFFTTVAQFGIFKTILDLNNELQKELQETQGKPSITINFTVEELKKLVGILNFTKQHYSVGVPEINALYESIMLTLKFLDGTIKSTDPKEIQTKVNETVSACVNTLKVYDFAWQSHFKKVLEDVNATQEELRKQAASQKN